VTDRIPTKVNISRTFLSGHAEVGVGAIVRPLLRRRTVFLVIETKPALILVEDDLSVLRALRRLMLSAGFKVMAFDRPRAVLDSELPKTDACLIVDVDLPEMNGVQLCETLAASGCRLPVIMITGRLDEATRELTHRAKAVAVLFKPFTRDALLEAISDALGAVKRV
jgi:FixJ family two-component response regulator